MSRIEKTVFVSYRRTNLAWALAIFQDLTQHGYDVFFDFEGIASGNFERVILENIRARAHFLVLLTPSALDRCGDPEDWLRREIETALETRRNIVPLMLEGFDFSTPPIANRLTGKLAALKQYNALPVPAAYFGEAMGRLRDKFLNVPLEAVFHLASAPAQQAAAAQQVAASAAHAVGQRELTAQEWPAEARQRAEEERSRQEVEPKRRAKEEEAQKHAPLTPAEEAAPAQPAPAALPLIDRYRAEGRIKVDATIVHGAPEGWFLPGKGKAEWFQDYEGGPEMVVVPAGKFMMGSPETEPERLTRKARNTR